MKKFLAYAIPLIIIAGITIYFVMSSKSIDDTKKLYISCNFETKSYNVITGTNVIFSDKDSECYLDIKISNVDKNYLKLKFSKYLYPLDGNKIIDEDSISHNFFVLPNELLVLYSYDKKTKFEFQYK